MGHGVERASQCQASSLRFHLLICYLSFNGLCFVFFPGLAKIVRRAIINLTKAYQEYDEERILFRGYLQPQMRIYINNAVSDMSTN